MPSWRSRPSPSMRMCPSMTRFICRRVCQTMTWKQQRNLSLPRSIFTVSFNFPPLNLMHVGLGSKLQKVGSTAIWKTSCKTSRVQNCLGQVLQEMDLRERLPGIGQYPARSRVTLMQQGAFYTPKNMLFSELPK